MRVLLLVALVGCGATLGTNEPLVADAPLPQTDAAVLDPDGPAVDAPLGAFSKPQPVPGVLPPVGQSDDDPTLTFDLLELYFNRNNDILVAKRATVNDPFGTATLVAELNTAAQETTPEISYDGLMIFLSSDRITAGNNDLFVATRATRNDPFGTPVRVGELSGANREAASASSDKLTIVFESDRDNPGIDNNTFIATRATAAQPFGTPVSVGAPNLTTSSDGNPMLSPDKLELYINTDRDGNAEMYRATRPTVNDPFGAATIITELADATSQESDPWISPDNRTLFMTRAVNGVTSLWFSTR